MINSGPNVLTSPEVWGDEMALFSFPQRRYAAGSFNLLVMHFSENVLEVPVDCLADAPPPLKNKSYVSFVAFPAAVSLGHAPMRASPLALNRSRHFLNLVQTSGSSTDSIGFAQLWSQKSFDKQAPDFAFWVFFR